MWTPEREERVKKFWLEGFSASECARLLGGVSRNAVIGKIHRLGLAARAAPTAPRRGALRTYTPRPKRSPVQTTSKKRRVYVEAPSEVGSATIYTLEAHMCRWPYGSGPYTFCGRYADKTYCPGHNSLSHGVLPQKRTRKRAS